MQQKEIKRKAKCNKICIDFGIMSLRELYMSTAKNVCRKTKENLEFARSIEDVWEFFKV